MDVELGLLRGDCTNELVSVQSKEAYLNLFTFGIPNWPSTRSDLRLTSFQFQFKNYLLPIQWFIVQVKKMEIFKEN